MDENKVADYVVELTDKQGASVVTVKDGWVLVFKKDHLQKIMNSTKEDKFIVFVKRSDSVPSN